MNTTVVGAYPKISDEHQELRRALHKADRGELDDAGLAVAFDEATEWAIGELADVGIDVINDGQIRWDDLLAPFAKAWRNCERGPLERFYDNNTYFRQPIIKGPIETDGQTLVRDFTFADGKLRGRAQLKAAVCGPLTFATLTAEDHHYKDLETRTLAIADALAKELAGLGAAGAKIVDVEEPALAAHPELVDLEADGALFTPAGNRKLALFVEQEIKRDLNQAKNERAIPLAGNEAEQKRVNALRPRTQTDGSAAWKGTVSLGVIDARNTRIETPRETGELVDAALKQLRDERRLILSTTTGLEYLPHDVARKKLNALVDAARAAKGVPA